MTDKRIKSYLEDRLKRLESIRNEREWTTSELGDITCCKQTLAFIDSLQKEPAGLDKGKLMDMLDDALSKETKESWNERLRKEEPVNDDFEKIVEEIAEPTILNAYGTKELAKRLRNTICGTSVSEDLEEAASRYAKEEYNHKSPATLSDRCRGCYAPLMYAFKAGAKWQKQQDQSTIELAEDHAMLAGMEKMKEEMMAKGVDGDITFDYYGDDNKTYGCIAHDSFCLEDFGLKDRDKVKVIVIKEG